MAADETARLAAFGVTGGMSAQRGCTNYAALRVPLHHLQDKNGRPTCLGLHSPTRCTVGQHGVVSAEQPVREQHVALVAQARTHT